MTGRKTPLWIVLAAMLWASQLPAAENVVRLQALLATSGDQVGNLLDGQAKTGWKPMGEPDLEGVLFRFEESIPVSHVEVRPCAKSPAFYLMPFVNSLRRDVQEVKGTRKIQMSKNGSKVLSLRSLFLRFSQAGHQSCIDEVVFFNGKNRINVQPPREVSAKVEVSSTLKPAAAYHKSYLFDQSNDFGWVEGVRGLGKGERISITFEEPREISAIQIHNGYQRSKDHFRKNARVARLKISTDQGQSAEMGVPDKMGASLLSFESKGKVTKLTLEIVKAKPGTRYKDLVISELRFKDSKGFFTVDTGEEAGLRSALAGKLSDRPLARYMDHQYESHCRVFSASAEMSGDARVSDIGLRRLKMRSNHRFVHYSQMAVGDEAKIVSESIEGIWVPVLNGKRKDPWSRISLYGRSQKIDHDINESYEVVTKRTKTRIIGGKLQIALVEDLGREGFLELVRKWEQGPAYYKVRCGAERFDYFSPDRRRKISANDAEFDKFYSALVKKFAIVVKGRAITDLFILDSH